jgi:hypothetical protein
MELSISSNNVCCAQLSADDAAHGMVNTFSIGQCCKVGHAQVNTHIFITGWQGFRLADITGKYGVPVVPLALDGQGFDRAYHIPVQMQFHQSSPADAPLFTDGEEAGVPFCGAGVGKSRLFCCSAHSYSYPSALCTRTQ